MTGKAEARLAALGLSLVPGPAPSGNFVPWVVSQGLAFISGQIPFQDGSLKYVGKVGREFSLEEAQACARLVAINILAQVKAACGGDLDRVVRCVKLAGFVNSSPDFTQQPSVINGASDLIADVFGDAGRHARYAVSVPSLPFGVAVEIDALFEVR